LWHALGLWLKAAFRIREDGRHEAGRGGDIDEQNVIRATERWIERAVIGLNLCPFAAGVYRGGRVRCAVSSATTPQALLDDFAAAAADLASADSALLDTTLLVHPWVLGDFFEYNEFLGECERYLAETDLEGVLQVASFHPQYQFAGTAADDVENCTNRSPYPMLHLLREASVATAIDAFGDTEVIAERNIRTLQHLGHAGWQRLWEPLA
jgi:uncharacterized protein